MTAVAEVFSITRLTSGVDASGKLSVECLYQILDQALQGNGSGRDARVNSIVLYLPADSRNLHRDQIIAGIIADAAAQAQPFELAAKNVSLPKYDGDGVRRKTLHYVVANGFTLGIDNNTDLVILEPDSALLTGTLTMPTMPGNEHLITACCTQVITTLAILPSSGQFIFNALTSIAAGGFAHYLYRTANSTWYRVG